MISDGALATIGVCVFGVVLMAVCSFVRDWSKGREQDKDIADHNRRINALEIQGQETNRLLRDQYGMISKQNGTLEEQSAMLRELLGRKVGPKS